MPIDSAENSAFSRARSRSAWRRCTSLLLQGLQVGKGLVQRQLIGLLSLESMTLSRHSLIAAQRVGDRVPVDCQPQPVATLVAGAKLKALARGARLNGVVQRMAQPGTVFVMSNGFQHRGHGHAFFAGVADHPLRTPCWSRTVCLPD